MQFRLNSVMVDNQDKVLNFSTHVLGFDKSKDIPVGEYRWLTVSSHDAPNAIDLLLEPIGFPPAKVYQKALFDAGIPLTAFFVPDIHMEFDRLNKLGVVFKTPPTQAGPATIAVFDDTCGNLIQIYQV